MDYKQNYYLILKQGFFNIKKVLVDPSETSSTYKITTAFKS